MRKIAHLLDLRMQLLGVAAQGAGLLHRQMPGASSPHDLQKAQSAGPGRGRSPLMSLGLNIRPATKISEHCHNCTGV